MELVGVGGEARVLEDLPARPALPGEIAADIEVVEHARAQAARGHEVDGVEGDDVGGEARRRGIGEALGDYDAGERRGEGARDRSRGQAWAAKAWGVGGEQTVEAVGDEQRGDERELGHEAHRARRQPGDGGGGEELAPATRTARDGDGEADGDEEEEPGIVPRVGVAELVDDAGRAEARVPQEVLWQARARGRGEHGDAGERERGGDAAPRQRDASSAAPAAKRAAMRTQKKTPAWNCAHTSARGTSSHRRRGRRSTSASRSESAPRPTKVTRCGRSTRRGRIASTARMSASAVGSAATPRRRHASQ